MAPLLLFMLAEAAGLDALRFDLRSLPRTPPGRCGTSQGEIVVRGRSAVRDRLGALPDLPPDPPLAIKLIGNARIEPGARKGTGLSLTIPF